VDRGYSWSPVHLRVLGDLAALRAKPALMDGLVDAVDRIQKF